MDDLSDAVLLCETSTQGYLVTRSTPAVWVNGRALKALPAVKSNWARNTTYAAGAQVNSQRAVFQAATGGTSASSGSGPAGIGSPPGAPIPDGTGALTWVFLGPVQSTATVFGSLQPVKGAELDRLPEEYRTKEVRAFWTTAELRTASPNGEADVIQADGFSWQVATVEYWGASGNYRKALIVRVGR